MNTYVKHTVPGSGHRVLTFREWKPIFLKCFLKCRLLGHALNILNKSLGDYLRNLYSNKYLHWFLSMFKLSRIVYRGQGKAYWIKDKAQRKYRSSSTSMGLCLDTSIVNWKYFKSKVHLMYPIHQTPQPSPAYPKSVILSEVLRV